MNPFEKARKSAREGLLAAAVHRVQESFLENAEKVFERLAQDLENEQENTDD